MSKHTPGPWRVIIDDDGNPLSGRPSVVASEELDCAIVHWDGFVQEFWRSARGDKEIHANARLIAAAPDMRAALSVARMYLSPRRDDPMAAAALEVVESALSLAEGGA